MILRSRRRKESTSSLCSTQQNKHKNNRVVRISQTQLSDLPSDLLFEILSRLPFTCLLRTAKCTCKLWHSIINDSSFADLHLTHTQNNPPGHLYALSAADSGYYFSDNPTIAIKLPVDLRTGNMKKYNRFVSCRGLLSYKSIQNNSIYICNPITGDQFKLPNTKLPRSRWGFGYAPSSNKYKYIEFSAERQPNKHFSVNGAIFTLGEESWRKLSDVSGDTYQWLDNPVYCNGALYWLVYGMPPKSVYHVVSFDFDTEKFRPRKVHHVGNTGDFEQLGPPSYLTLYGETVALVTSIGKTTSQEVWVLINEAENVWVEKYNFHFRMCLWSEEMDILLWELWIKRHDKYLKPDSVHDEVTRKQCLTYYSYCKTYSVRAVAVKLPLANDSPQRVIIHVGSLLSPSKIGEPASKQPFLVTT